MIFTASLAIVTKKALGDKCFQTSIGKIIETLPIDPEISGMDAVILGPRDAAGPNGMKLQKAIDTAHKNVCVIYLYCKDREKDLINCPYKKIAKKITDKVIFDAQEEFLGAHLVKAGKQVINNKDNEVPITSKPDIPQDTPAPAIPGVKEEVSAPAPLVIPEAPALQEEPAAPVEEPKVTHMEDALRSITNYNDWNLFREQMQKDNITRKLIEENTEFVGLINMLEVMDKQIETVWRDPALSTEKKFDKIREIGLNRAGLRARTNDINANKVMSIIETVCLAAKRTVEEKLDSTEKALLHITTRKDELFDTARIDKAIEERMNIELELCNLKKSLIELYKSMDCLVQDETIALDQKLPSDNEFVNYMVRPIGSEVFTPTNTIELANKMGKALQEGRITMSQLEVKIEDLIRLIFQLCEKDNDIVRYQQELISLMRVNKVEEIVVRDTLLKGVLRLFTGEDYTGRSATAITLSGVESRKENVLLIDMTERDRFDVYGVNARDIDEFFQCPTEEHFVCLRSKKRNPEEIQEMVSNLKNVIHHYPIINIIVAPEDTQAIEQLSEDALCINYVTDCSTRSMDKMREVTKANTVTNIARKLVMIDTPISPLVVAKNLEIDPMLYKMVPIPSIPTIKACAIKHDRPFDFESVVTVFEEAFR